MDELKNENYRSGFITVLGRPNVGKSTLVNALLGQKIAAVSPKPQTTRARQLAILTDEDAQIILMDTPGMHNPIHKLGGAMNAIVEETLQDSDIILWLVDASQPPQGEDILIANFLRAARNLPPVVMGLNKIDLLSKEELDAQRIVFGKMYSAAAEVIPISARRNSGLDDLLAKLKSMLPVGSSYYPAEQVTDYQERQIAADLIREAALIFLQQEVPHAIAVRVDEYSERESGAAYVAATIFVERDSQKGIVIGSGGKMLKKIGSVARKSIEEMSGRSIFLQLRVKVSENWRDNAVFLRRMGYETVEKK
ncbi:MAG: GTPase Era [Anaerolineaceae bacterium]|nr:MAG: GTPase Era [Anaerolineaceae bacterium]